MAGSTVRTAAALVLFAGLLALPIAGAAETRIALVIGNGYKGEPGYLKNPPNDARLMGETLRRLGFDVDVGIDLDQEGILGALARFGSACGGPGRTASACSSMPATGCSSRATTT